MYIYIYIYTCIYIYICIPGAMRPGSAAAGRREKELHTSNRHLRNHLGCSVAFSNRFCVACSNKLSPFSCLSPNGCRFSSGFTGNSNGCSVAFSSDVLFREFWCVIFCPESWLSSSCRLVLGTTPLHLLGGVKRGLFLHRGTFGKAELCLSVCLLLFKWSNHYTMILYVFVCLYVFVVILLYYIYIYIYIV